MTHSKQNRLINRVSQTLKDNQPAIQLVLQLVEISQTIDDVIDQDKPLTVDRLNRCFWMMLIELPNNSLLHGYEFSENYVRT